MHETIIEEGVLLLSISSSFCQGFDHTRYPKIVSGRALEEEQFPDFNFMDNF